MKKVTAGMAKKTTRITQRTKDTGIVRKHASDGSGLAHRYRQIGISAVAAAVRYQGVAKNPAYAPAPINWRESAEDAVA
jgi:hypothetical protein